MSENAGNVNYRITATPQGVAEVLNRTNQQVQRTAATAQRASNSFKDVQRSISGVLGPIAALGSGVAAVSKLVQGFEGFKFAADDVARSLGDVAAKIDTISRTQVTGISATLRASEEQYQNTMRDIERRFDQGFGQLAAAIRGDLEAISDIINGGDTRETLRLQAESARASAQAAAQRLESERESLEIARQLESVQERATQLRRDGLSEEEREREELIERVVRLEELRDRARTNAEKTRITEAINLEFEAAERIKQKRIADAQELARREEAERVELAERAAEKRERELEALREIRDVSKDINRINGGFAGPGAVLGLLNSGNVSRIIRASDQRRGIVPPLSRGSRR